MRDDFQTLFEFLPIGAYRSSPDGRILRANRALARLNGYETEAEHLASVTDIGVGWYVEPGRREVFKRLIERDGRVIAFVSQVNRRKAGGIAWISENAHLVRDAQGRPDYYEGTVEDITERVLSQQALEASRQELAHMIDLVPGVVYKYRFLPGGPRHFTYVGRSIERLFGIRAERVMAEPDLILRLRHPDDRQRVDREVTHALGTRVPLDIEYRVVLDDARVRWIRMTSAHAPDEQGLQVRVGMIFDITDHKRAEEALRDNGELWKSALEQTGDGVWDWDLAQGREQLSAQGLALFGYRPGELPDSAEALDALTHPDD
ncbi:MAG: PAS domain S-box protein, partial [Rubrivivax sp.]|nr:PAS domain S-box protein [Rubrivivax sp.]